MRRTARKVFVPFSILVCVRMVAILFTRLYEVTSKSPVIVSPRFKCWTTDPV